MRKISSYIDKKTFMSVQENSIVITKVADVAVHKIEIELDEYNKRKMAKILASFASGKSMPIGKEYVIKLPVSYISYSRDGKFLTERDRFGEISHTIKGVSTSQGIMFYTDLSHDIDEIRKTNYGMQFFLGCCTATKREQDIMKNWAIQLIQ